MRENGKGSERKSLERVHGMPIQDEKSKKAFRQIPLGVNARSVELRRSKGSRDGFSGDRPRIDETVRTRQAEVSDEI